MDDTLAALEAFFAGEPAVIPLAQAILSALRRRWPALTCTARKTQLDICDGRAFCWLSPAARGGAQGRPARSLLLTFGLARPLDSARILHSAHPSPHRWTHHLWISDAGQLDETLWAWLEEAHALRCAPPASNRV